VTALDQQPTETNFLNPNNFKFLLRRAPNIQFFIQKVNLPGVSSEPAKQDIPFVVRPLPGGPAVYEPLQIEFKVTENLLNYLELYNWFHAAHHSTNLKEYGVLKNVPKYSDEGILSEVVLVILDSSRVPTFEIVYHDAWPTALSAITFAADAEGVLYAMCTATFSYFFFEIENLKPGTPNPDPLDIITS
jgi:hypothetical protein